MHPYHRHLHHLQTGTAVCASVIALSLFAATPGYSAENEAKIDEVFTIQQPNSVTHEVTVHDFSKTLTEEACQASPVALDWSSVTFTQATYSNDCTIRTEFNRYANPYVGIDEDGKLTFATSPLTLEKLSLGLPENTVVSRQSVTLSGFYMRFIKTSSGAQMDDSHPNFSTVEWTNIYTPTIAAEGIVEKAANFHTIERKNFNGVVAVPMPTNLQDASYARRATATSSPTTQSSSSGSSNDDDPLISGICDHSLAYMVRQTPEAQGQNGDSHSSISLQLLLYSKRDRNICSHFPESFCDGVGRRIGCNRRCYGTLQKSGFYAYGFPRRSWRFTAKSLRATD